MQARVRSSLKQQLRQEAAEAILDAAERVVAGEGIGGASMQRVAREARVSVGTLYNYFGDRDSLLRQLMLRHRRDLSRALQAASEATRGQPFEEQARRFVQTVMETFDARHGFVRAALDSELWRALARSPGGDSEGIRVRQQLERRARELVQVGIEQGLLQTEAPARLAAFLSGAIRGLLLLRAHSERPSDAAAEALSVVTLFVRGARTGPARATRSVTARARARINGRNGKRDGAGR